MHLSEIGEFGFIERFAHRFKDLLTPNSMGIGDDCAVLPCDENHDLVITTDMLVEDIHFIRNKISPYDLGYKSLAVNLSDVAAMGARPIGSFLSVAIPENIEVECLDELMDGYHALSEKFRLPLMGGDTTKSPDKLILNISVIGKIEKGKARLRSMAQSGDVIAVTDTLGDSAAGLQLILKGLNSNLEADWLINRHNRPEADVEEGIWLAQQSGVNAMMDVSDGIASDINHILKASKKGAEIDLKRLPLSHQLINIAEKHQFNPIELATSGGEDYCLLLTINAEKFQNISASFENKFGKKLFDIGKVTGESGSLKWFSGNREIAVLKGGFNHFE
ncbi:thiamine-phosphate kinase [Natronoflexus pectinivorans]|uniref:Thiamine-monophosphate kinase n=1 Tax=Natronoflexus pectinivorans TaxID=682526 RepID=A0A4R2GKT6_9BACT|nr:thiamine-phosphate kinase [Natronoflexus pectinivorans]TCO09177.1 thiamine-monophosphate kinase [Natronoflexus pectinivorans]